MSLSLSRIPSLQFSVSLLMHAASPSAAVRLELICDQCVCCHSITLMICLCLSTNASPLDLTSSCFCKMKRPVYFNGSHTEQCQFCCAVAHVDKTCSTVQGVPAGHAALTCYGTVPCCTHSNQVLRDVPPSASDATVLTCADPQCGASCAHQKVSRCRRPPR